MLRRESNIRVRHCGQALRAGLFPLATRLVQSVRKFCKAGFANRSEQVRFVLKVPIRGHSRHTELSANLSECEGANTFLFDQPEAGLNEFGPEISVVITGSCCLLSWHTRIVAHYC